ncbi:hypothetical protein JCM11491_002922 [Sporobolomyces phaffii]
MSAFNSKQHVLFSLRHAKYLPTPYEPEDANRMTLAYFCISALALLPCPSSDPAARTSDRRSALETMLRPVQRQGFVDWVYQQQLASGGFRGSDSMALPPTLTAILSSPVTFSSPVASSSRSKLDPPNIIQSYTAILILALLDDPLDDLDRSGLLRLVGQCQNSDGSFSLFPESQEPGDPRSTYSAFAIASMLNDWSTINVDTALKFLDSCRTYEGAFAQRPHLEANAGPTYCAIASYYLCDRLSDLRSRPTLLRWLLHRQISPDSHTSPPRSPSSIPSSRDSEDPGDDEGEDQDDYEETHRLALALRRSAGFQGRTNKPLDACYSFWSLGALRLLVPDPHEFASTLDPTLNSEYLLACQHPLYGGIAREPGAVPDVYHSYLGLAALSIGQPRPPPSPVPAPTATTTTVHEREGIDLGLGQLDVAWNVEEQVAKRIRDRIEGLQERDRRRESP